MGYNDMGAVLALNKVDLNAITFITMSFFTSGLSVESESTIQAENTEKQN